MNKLLSNFLLASVVGVAGCQPRNESVGISVQTKVDLTIQWFPEVYPGVFFRSWTSASSYLKKNTEHSINPDYGDGYVRAKYYKNLTIVQEGSRITITNEEGNVIFTYTIEKPPSTKI